MPRFEKPFPKKLTKIDELTRANHGYLDADDLCMFLGEYTARAGFAFSATNHLVLNFKKGIDRKGKPEWRYRQLAIKEAAAAFRAALKPEFWDLATLVPVPPSKAKRDPKYNDRMLQMLRSIKDGLDVRELVIQTETTEAAHESDVRLRPEELEEIYRLDHELLLPAPRLLAVFDDVISAGAHFKAMQTILRRQFPGVPIWGFFIARRVPEADDFDIFFPNCDDEF